LDYASINKLREFVIENLLANEDRLIVALERKGASMLWALTKGPEVLSRVVTRAYVRACPSILKSYSQIVVFDDVVWTGNALREFIEELSLLLDDGKKPPETACLFYRSGLKNIPPIRPDDRISCKSSRELVRDTTSLVRLLIQQGRPINIDHIICDIELSRFTSFEKLLKAFANRGGLYRTYEDQEEDVEFWSLDQPSFFQLHNGKNDKPRVFEEGAVKVRLNRVGRKIRIIPITFPLLELNGMTTSQCGYRTEWTETNFCDTIINGKNGGACVGEYCYSCVCFNLSFQLLMDFLSELSNITSWNLKEINKRELIAVYPFRDSHPLDWMEHSLKAGIQSSRTHDKIELVEVTPAAKDKIIAEDGIPLKDLVAQIGPVIAAIGYKRRKMKKRRWLTLTEICRAFSGFLSYIDISRALDYLFDRNFLKPETKEVKFQSGQRTGFARTYSFSGELVGALLRGSLQLHVDVS